jgi:aldose 1-epimerase
MLNSNSYTPVDDTLITTGEIKPVKGTIFDLTANQNVNELLKKFPEGPNGYDNNFCVNFPEEGVRLVARYDIFMLHELF